MFFIRAENAGNRALPNPFYPQVPQGELRLNYYYDRSGRWVKFSDWIPFRQRKYEPLHLEDFYQLYGLPMGYNTAEVKESIYFLVEALTHRFRHPGQALCRITTEAEHLKYRNLMFMHINLLIMRMYLRLGSLYDLRYLRYYNLDVADDLEVSFMVARTYYGQAVAYWNQAKQHALLAGEHRFMLDFPALESERFMIMRGKLDFAPIIQGHIDHVEKNLASTQQLLDREGRPRPVKVEMQNDILRMYDQDFPSDPLGPPVLSPRSSETPLFP